MTTISYEIYMLDDGGNLLERVATYSDETVAFQSLRNASRHHMGERYCVVKAVTSRMWECVNGEMPKEVA